MQVWLWILTSQVQDFKSCVQCVHSEKQNTVAQKINQEQKPTWKNNQKIRYAFKDILPPKSLNQARHEKWSQIEIHQENLKYDRWNNWKIPRSAFLLLIDQKTGEPWLGRPSPLSYLNRMWCIFLFLLWEAQGHRGNGEFCNLCRKEDFHAKGCRSAPCWVGQELGAGDGNPRWAQSSSLDLSPELPSGCWGKGAQGQSKGNRRNRVGIREMWVYSGKFRAVVNFLGLNGPQAAKGNSRSPGQTKENLCLRKVLGNVSLEFKHWGTARSSH